MRNTYVTQISISTVNSVLSSSDHELGEIKEMSDGKGNAGKVRGRYSDPCGWDIVYVVRD